MNNAALKAALTELSDRVCMIIVDNDRRISIGYKDSPLQDVNDIQYKTWGGEDFFGYSRASTYTMDRDLGVTYTTWHRTDMIQQIVAMDDGFADYRMDPATA